MVVSIMATTNSEFGCSTKRLNLFTHHQTSTGHRACPTSTGHRAKVNILSYAEELYEILTIADTSTTEQFSCHGNN